MTTNPEKCPRRWSRLIACLLFLLLMTVSSKAELPGQPLRILCIGDSITQAGVRDREEYSYRLPLQSILHTAGISFDFIGTRSEGLHPDAVWPEAAGRAFDPQHEGYYGWRTAPVVAEVEKHLPELDPPDVVLVHLGTNDQKHGDFAASVGQPLRELINRLRERNPAVIILLGHLNFDAGPSLEIRKVVETVAAESDRPESPVRTVPHYLGWVADPTAAWSDTFDWAHPNPRGQTKMAEAWWHALRPLLSGPAPVPRTLPEPRFTSEERAEFGRGLGRSLRLLASGTADEPAHFRILFYGQSITEDAWWRQVVTELQARHPHTRIIAQNRALGGCAAQRLVRTVATDLQGFDPDLILFHVFGADAEYEAIVRHFRTHTTADVLLQTDHLGRGADWRSEPTDPDTITRDNWPAFMNYVHLPTVAERYGCGLLRQRDFWKRFLDENGLEPGDLLRDQIHLNAAGNRLMAQLVLAYLSGPIPSGPDPFQDDRVRSLLAGRDFRVEDETVEINFIGNRVDLVSHSESAGSEFSLRLDGRLPSEHRECWAFTRATPQPGGKWPALHGIRSEALPVAETWTLEVERTPGTEAAFSFQLEGSVTGPDGDGSSDLPFVSNSGRVAFDPEGWDVAHAMKLAGIETLPDRFKIVWESYPLVRDTVIPDASGTTTLVSGIHPGEHRLTLCGPLETLSALRIFRPPHPPE